MICQPATHWGDANMIDAHAVIVAVRVTRGSAEGLLQARAVCLCRVGIVSAVPTCCGLCFVGIGGHVRR